MAITGNIILPRVIKIQPTMTADDNADDDVAFDWTEIANASSYRGKATKLVSVAILDADDSAAALELVFCRGNGDLGTAPTAAQGLIADAVAGSAVPDITAAIAQAIGVCGNVQMALSEGDLLTAYIISATSIDLIMQPKGGSSSLYVGGIWRGANPAVTGATGSLDIYLGFES